MSTSAPSRVPARGENYWPAFVDALTNVVLNLLFLVAVSVFGLFVLNLQARRAGEVATQAAEQSLVQAQVHELSHALPAPPADRIGAATSPSAVTNPIAPLSPPAQPAPVDPTTAPTAAPTKVYTVPAVPLPRADRVDLRIDRLGDDQVLLVVSFGAGTLDIAPARRDVLLGELRPLLGRTGGQPLVVWTNAGLANPLARRLAAQRNLAVRDLLAAAGQPVDAVQLRIVDGSTSRPDTADVYVSALPEVFGHGERNP